jgi:hypothetical protein
MSWGTAAERMALLELLASGALRRRQTQAQAFDALAELPWTRRTGRRDELALVEQRRTDLVALIDRVWPAWGDVLAALTARGLATTPEGWAALQDAARAADLPQLPEQLNRRTAAALVAPHSKSTLTDRRNATLGGAEATHDGSIRLRPPRGLVATTAKGRVDLSDVASVLGEVSIPERALKAGLALEGPIRAALLVENLGAFCDLPALDGWLYAHVAGWDTATVARLLERLGHVPLVHFGDLDPNGLRIVQHLRGLRPDLVWFVPEFWGELIEARGLPCVWPQDPALDDAPDLVRLLARKNLWLEQEPVTLDPRTRGALEMTVPSPRNPHHLERPGA